MTPLPEAVRAAILPARARSVETAARWRAGAEVRAFEAWFAGCAADEAEAVADRAEALLADAGWAEALLAPLVEALAADPFFDPPFRTTRDGVRTGAVLLDPPVATLTATVTHAAALAALPPPETIVFSGRLSVTRYLRAGRATLRRWEAEPVTPAYRAAGAAPCREVAPVPLADGEVTRCDGRRQGQVASAPHSDMVALAITARAGAPLVRIHRIADGALLRIASADEGASRAEMLLAWLRCAGRAEAGSLFEAASRDAAFQLRWAAMREWLALDARTALPRLAEMAAADPNAEVRAAAATMLGPVRERVECPA
ncbi:hypothetical protein [Sphingomonas sp.]|uniref:hypothetical protein n=1 Tax=Sphingomonas sp. TaxID=28214 RepID=UPI001B17E2EA|nr:hypothetical protein [Sphingomonas sp.]MBO9715183.1 hypothetical protein [Sphingomonas sp.]